MRQETVINFANFYSLFKTYANVKRKRYQTEISEQQLLSKDTLNNQLNSLGNTCCTCYNTS